MPKIRWLQSVVGPDFERQADQITDEPEAIAAIWADGSRAVRVEEKRETTSRSAPENAARTTGRGESR